MNEPTNVTHVVLAEPFERMQRISELADLIDPAHSPWRIHEAVRALGDGTLYAAAAEVVDECIAHIPDELRTSGQ